MNGRILDRSTGEPVAYAVLTTLRGGRQVGVQAGDDGRWSFDFQPGEQVRVQLTGYDAAVVDAANLVPITYLSPGAGTLPEFAVVGSRKSSLGLWLLGGLLLLVAASSSRR